MAEAVAVLNLSKEFSPYPAGRTRRDGQFSGWRAVFAGRNAFGLALGVGDGPALEAFAGDRNRLVSVPTRFYRCQITRYGRRRSSPPRPTPASRDSVAR